MIEIESDPEPYPPLANRSVCAGLLLVLLCIGSPFFAIGLAQAYPNTYDAMLSRTVVLTLGSQVGLVKLPEIRRAAQLRIVATGSIRQDARAAVGLITFYNGQFTEQVVPAGTTLTGQAGVSVVTQAEAIVPPATPTTPPTDGTISVPAQAAQAGSAGNIAAQDINRSVVATRSWLRTSTPSVEARMRGK